MRRRIRLSQKAAALPARARAPRPTSCIRGQFGPYDGKRNSRRKEERKRKRDEKDGEEGGMNRAKRQGMKLTRPTRPEHDIATVLLGDSDEYGVSTSPDELCGSKFRCYPPLCYYYHLLTLATRLPGKVIMGKPSSLERYLVQYWTVIRYW
ncbi:jg4174 [Pararge aegeria aegeria]|uniref:Jg4174 protein n=1 Tax=Pararge aegeria aegeria TaxID=348720 RepID=A0A8S4S9S2_9NEOP|nr:jg4174 [Pararge aegeria aegeria]